MMRGAGWLLLTMALFSAACGSRGPAPAPLVPDAAAPVASAPPTMKVITIGVLDETRLYGHLEYPGGGLASLSELLSNGLVTNGVSGGLTPRVAASLPSLDDGSVLILPDGRMQSTWKLR